MSPRFAPDRLRGSIPALFTPFTDDGALDTAGIRRMVDWQIAAGSHAVSIGGSTGEPSAQTTAERITAIETVADQVAGRVPFIAGTGSAKLDETLDVTAAAARAGADAALVITPYYSRPTQEGLYRWYRTVADEFPDLPVIAYNVPSRAAVELAPETVARLFSECENFIGVKETTKDFEHFSRVLHACGPELMVWSGIELLALPVLSLGGAGFITAVANLAPHTSAQVYDSWVAGDLDAARWGHFALHPLADLLFVETNPAPGKWVLQQQGRLTAAHVRPPLIGLSDAGIPRVEALLAEAADVIEAERAY